MFSIGKAEGQAEGEAKGILETVYGFVSDSTITPSQGAKKLNISVRKLKADMVKAGYKYPEK